MMGKDLLNELKLRTEKEGFVPTEEEAQYIGALQNQWTNDWNAMNASYDFFQRKNLQSYMQNNENDSYLLAYLTRKEAWRSNTRRQTIREKIDAVMAAVADLNLQSELQSYTVMGQSAEAMAEGLEVLLQYADGLNNSEEKDKLSVLSLLTHGTVVEDVSWLERWRIEKTSEWDPKTMKFTLTVRKDPVLAVEQIWTQTHPLNRLLLGDIEQPEIQLQPHIWAEYVMPYDTGETMFGDWERWKYVVPMTATTLDAQQSDLITQTQEEQAASTEPRMIRMRVYENIWRNEMAILINNVLMTPVGLTMPTKLKDLAYSKTWTQLFPFTPHFAPGMSFVQRMHNDAVLLDFFYNALVDKARQGIEPPLVSSFRTIFNRNMFRPGTVAQGDVNTKPLVQHAGVTTADMGMIEYIETNLDKASTPPIFSGQSPAKGTMTAYEVREQQRNALRTMWNVFSAVANMKKQRTQLMLRLILEKYPHMKRGPVPGKSAEVAGGIQQLFSVKGTVKKDGTEGIKEVAFAKMPETQDEIGALKMALYDDAEAAKAAGTPTKRIVIDPEIASEMRHTVQVIVNPSDRKSKKADKFEAHDEFMTYAQFPMVFDQQWAGKILLTANGRDPQDGLAKTPPAQPGMPGQGMAMPQPGMEPAVPPVPNQAPAESAMNSMAQAANVT